eukprot:354551-Chlamydomonas_euryale.AAC.16
MKRVKPSSSHQERVTGARVAQTLLSASNCVRVWELCVKCEAQAAEQAGRRCRHISARPPTTSLLARLPLHKVWAHQRGGAPQGPTASHGFFSGARPLPLVRPSPVQDLQQHAELVVVLAQQRQPGSQLHWRQQRRQRCAGRRHGVGSQRCMGCVRLHGAA